ncbi:MAG: hypothetical protein AAF790_09135, partial [Planctomycetota bacterium]
CQIAGELRLAGRVAARPAMPVYLFTYHTYGTWLPDHPRGYVRRGEGVLPTDHNTANQYRRRMKQATVLLGGEQQKAAIGILLNAVASIDAKLHGVATEPTHLHVLTSWNDDRTHERIGSSLKRGLTLGLKKRFGDRFGDRQWLSENRSRKQIKEREHFQHLLADYFPRHSGWKWSEARGYFRTADG